MLPFIVYVWPRERTVFEYKNGQLRLLPQKAIKAKYKTELIKNSFMFTATQRTEESVLFMTSAVFVGLSPKKSANFSISQTIPLVSPILASDH